MDHRRQAGLALLLFVTALLLAACGPSASAGPTPDTVGQQVAIQKAVAATLTADAASVAATGPAPAAITGTPAAPDVEPSATPAATNPPAAPADTPTSTVNPPAAACVVGAGGANLRAGPGTAFPPLAGLPAGLSLQPLAFQARGFPSGQWIQVQAGTQNGWVSASQQSVTCNIDPASLPPGTFPPPPTATPTRAAPTPTPTPEALAQANIGDNDVLVGENGSLQGGVTLRVKPIAKNPLVFGSQIAFEVRARVSSMPGNQNGAGIKEVRFAINAGDQQDDTQIVYNRTESTAAYCVFGGGEPNCNVLDLNKSSTWPDTHTDVYDGIYYVDIVAVPKDNKYDSAHWHFTFTIQR